MKPSHFDGLTLCTMLIVLGSAPGCGQPIDDGGRSSSAGNSSASSGGAVEEEVCTDGGVEFPIDVNISFPDCTPLGSALILQGMIDGKPFEQTYMYSGASLAGFFSPLHFKLGFGHEGDYPRNIGEIDLTWREATYPVRRAVLIPVLMGTVSLQEDTLDRAVNPGSTVRIGCDQAHFQFNLIMDSGQLIGCARKK